MTNIIMTTINGRLSKQFVKFCIVGFICTLLDWFSYYLILMVIGIDTQLVMQLVKGASFAISVSLSYLLNRSWTFKSKSTNILQEAFKFLFVAFIGLLINQTAFYIVTAQFNQADIYGLVSGTAGATLWNFFLNKKWTFKSST